ncbi:hypothetical protein [Micromonospora violae]|uniref:hypothetical protein n=1 Tax=Micromonospora violae TaxID=1278207 RepID=UPI0034054AF9
MTTVVAVLSLFYARAAFLMAEEQEQHRNADQIAIWTVRKGNALNPYGTDAVQIQNRSSDAAASVTLVSWNDEQPLSWAIKDDKTTIDTYGAWSLDDLGACTSLVLAHPDPESRQMGLIFILDGQTWLVVAGQPLMPLGKGSYVVRNKMTSVTIPVVAWVADKNGNGPTMSPRPPADGQWQDSAC